MARHLAGVPKAVPKEASCRSAVGRAYYSAFGHLRDVLESAGFLLPKTGEAHGRLVVLLRSSSHERVRSAAGGLQDLRRKRNSADYDVGGSRTPSEPFDPFRGGLAVCLAADIIGVIDAHAARDPSLGIPRQ